MTIVFLGCNSLEGWSSLLGFSAQTELTYISVQLHLATNGVQLIFLSGLIWGPLT